MSSQGDSPAQKPRDPDFVGADAAMRRAAKRAQLRAKETAKMAAANKGSAGSGEIHGTNTGRDPRERNPRKSE